MEYKVFGKVNHRLYFKTGEETCYYDSKTGPRQCIFLRTKMYGTQYECALDCERVRKRKSDHCLERTNYCKDKYSA
jgi:hypothetical protein